MILPLLTTIVAIQVRDVPKRRRLMVIAASWLLFGLFFAWRFHAMSGLGYVPALAAQKSARAHLPWSMYLQGWLMFVLPRSLGPGTAISGIAIWVFGVAVPTSRSLANR